MSSAEISTVNRFNWLELPVNVVYTLHGFQMYAGPYVAMAVGGRERGTLLQASPTAFYVPYEFDGNIPYGPDTENRRLDAGFNFGLGIARTRCKCSWATTWACAICISSPKPTASL